MSSSAPVPTETVSPPSDNPEDMDGDDEEEEGASDEVDDEDDDEDDERKGEAACMCNSASTEEVYAADSSSVITERAEPRGVLTASLSWRGSAQGDETDDEVDNEVDDEEEEEETDKEGSELLCRRKVVVHTVCESARLANCTIDKLVTGHSSADNLRIIDSMVRTIQKWAVRH